MSLWSRVLGYGGPRVEREGQGGEDRATPGVRVGGQRLNKLFGSHHVLRDLDLPVEPGETFVIFGPSGCGKSVLLKHITGLLSPDSGRILVAGEDLWAGGGAGRS